MAAGRAEGVEVVAVTSGGTEKLSRKRRKLLNTPFIIPQRSKESPVSNNPKDWMGWMCGNPH